MVLTTYTEEAGRAPQEGGGSKGPPSAPPAIPPIIINPFSYHTPTNNIDPPHPPPGPPVRPPCRPCVRMA